MSKLLKKETPRKQEDEMLKHYTAWKANNSYIKEYDKDELRPGDVLIRLYQYTPKVTTSAASRLIDDKGVPLIAKTYRRIIPVAKVIKVNIVDNSPFPDLKPGDIITVSDSMATSKINPEWHMYQEMLKERPAPTVDEVPPKYINRFSEWNKYLYITDKIKASPTNSDALTFIIPQVLIKTRKKS